MNHLILAIGAGRDGTTTLQQIINKIFLKNKHDGVSHHQKDHQDLYNQFCLYKKYGSRDYYLNILKRIKQWKLGDAIIGNGYAHVLNIILDIHGEKLKLIHLKRQKRTWMDSFRRNIETFPWNHGNYSDSKEPKINRIAAFHFNECSKDAWNHLSMEDKLNWYYEKNHDLINSKKNLIQNVLNIETEKLSSEKNLHAITKFIDEEWLPINEGTHVNTSKMDYEDLNQNDRIIVSRFYSRFDYVRSAKDPFEGEAYFFHKIIDGFLNRYNYEYNAISLDALCSYNQILKKRIDRIERLIESEDRTRVSTPKNA